MAKCDICSRKIPTTFLGKIVGTIVYDSNHKQKYVCKDCQSEHTGKDLKEILETT